MSILILGIDPGVTNTGYTLILYQNKKPILQQHGMILTNNSFDSHQRMRHIAMKVDSLVREWKPDYAGTEQYFVSKKPKFNRKGESQSEFNKNDQHMNQAIGAILVGLGQMPAGRVHQFTPIQMKKAMTGNGAAKKPDVQDAVRRILGLASVLEPDHVADSAGMALSKLEQTPEFKKDYPGLHLSMPLFQPW